MKIKHSKYKNAGLLFELLVRQITADTLSGKSSPSLDILKISFANTELGKEYIDKNKAKEQYELYLKIRILVKVGLK